MSKLDKSKHCMSKSSQYGQVLKRTRLQLRTLRPLRGVMQIEIRYTQEPQTHHDSFQSAAWVSKLQSDCHSWQLHAARCGALGIAVPFVAGVSSECGGQPQEQTPTVSCQGLRSHGAQIVACPTKSPFRASHPRCVYIISVQPGASRRKGIVR